MPAPAAMEAPALAERPLHDLEAMHDAATALVAAQTEMVADGASPLADVLGATGSSPAPLREWDHVPPGDACDEASGGQFYYHAHAAHERVPGEHGHFHLFLRPGAAALDPAPDTRYPHADPHAPASRIAHLVAISVDAHGRPFRLFTTNRWVCDETWYRAADVIGFLPHFDVTGAAAPARLARWLAAMVALFTPQIADLLHARDAAIAKAHAAGNGNVLEDRALQELSETRIDLGTQIAAVERALGLS